MSRLEKITERVSPILSQHGCNAVQITFRREKPGWVLRLLIERIDCDLDSGSGIDHKICSTVSREIGEDLEEADFLDQTYTLEVSSPGIERPLVGPKDYTRFAGRRATVKTVAPVDGRKVFTGVIESCDSETLSIRVDDGVSAKIPLERITKANLVFDPDRVGTNAGEK